jgi:hypothetical protein
MIPSLTSSNYWHEIEALEIEPPARDQLKSMVSAYLSSTSPPTVNSRELAALLASGITVVVLSDSAGKHYLEIAEFVPEDPERCRHFTYLRKTYTGGTNRKLAYDTPLLETQLYARFLGRCPDPGVCRVMGIDWRLGRVDLSNGSHSYHPLFEDIAIVPAPKEPACPPAANPQG